MKVYSEESEWQTATVGGLMLLGAAMGVAAVPLVASFVISFLFWAGMHLGQFVGWLLCQ